MDEYIELTEDRGLYKKILREGDGSLPSENSKLYVNYKIHLEDGFLIEEKINEYFDFEDINKLLGLKIGIKTMKKTEKSIFVMRYDYGFGEKFQNNSARYPSVISHVELVDIK